MSKDSFIESKKTSRIITIFIIVLLIRVNSVISQTNNVINPSTDLLYYNYAKDNSINFKTIVDNANDYFREYHLHHPFIKR